MARSRKRQHKNNTSNKKETKVTDEVETKNNR